MFCIMSEPKRAALTTLSTNKCDKKSTKEYTKTVRLNISLIEPNEDSCSVFNYTTLLNATEKKRLKKKQQQQQHTPDGKVNGVVNPFDDEDEEDVKRIARQFEEKYGTSDRGKQNRCQTYAELGAGYDESDSFIDNTDACDEALPEEMQTVHGGYYVNSGPLEFKRVECSDMSDYEEVKGRKRKFGANVIRDSETEEEEEDDEEDDEDDEEEEEEDDDEEEEILDEEIKDLGVKEEGVVSSNVPADSAVGTPASQPPPTDSVKVKLEVKEEKVDEESSAGVVKKIKLTEKSEDTADVEKTVAVITKSEPTVLADNDDGNAVVVKKKRKKRTLTMAERQQLLEQQQQDVNSTVNVPQSSSVPVGTVNNNAKVTSNTIRGSSGGVNSAAAVVSDSGGRKGTAVAAGSKSVSSAGNKNSSVSGSNSSSNNNNLLTNCSGNVLTNNSDKTSSSSSQNNTSDSINRHGHKKKTKTVKALLEEKRTVNESSSNSVVGVPASNSPPASGVTTSKSSSTVVSSNEAGVVSKKRKEYTSVCDVIEYVINNARDGESSKESSSSTSKLHIGTNSGGAMVTPEVPPSESKKDKDKDKEQHTSVSDVIEFVISSAKDGESSKDSTSSISKSHSDSDVSSESSDSQAHATKNQLPPNTSSNKTAASAVANEIPPMPENLTADVIDLITNIKMSITQSQSDITRRNFTPEVNNMLLSLEKLSQNLSGAARNMVYEHLAVYLPCSKFTLMKRAKKLYLDSVELKMNEPLKKLKCAVDAAMPLLLEKYSKECQQVAAEKSIEDPASTDLPGDGNVKSESMNVKLPRKKFVWNNDMRLYVRELIELRNQCYLIKNPRRESRDAYISSFLTSKVQSLWPPGWMKSTILLREAGEAQPACKTKKPTTPQHSPPSQSGAIVSSQQPQYSQQKSPLQSLNISLPSNTTLTPAFSKEHNSYQSSTPKRNSITITTSPSQTVKPPPVVSSKTPKAISISVSPSPSPPKKQMISPKSNSLDYGSKEQFQLYNLMKNQQNDMGRGNESCGMPLGAKNVPGKVEPVVYNVGKDTTPKTDLGLSGMMNNSKKVTVSVELPFTTISPAITSNISNYKNNVDNPPDVIHSSSKRPLKPMLSNEPLDSISNKGSSVNRNKSITLNGSSAPLSNSNKSNYNVNKELTPPTAALAASGSNTPLPMKPIIKRELKSDSVNNNGVKVDSASSNCINVDSILDLSSSNCGGSAATFPQTSRSLLDNRTASFQSSAPSVNVSSSKVGLKNNQPSSSPVLMSSIIYNNSSSNNSNKVDSDKRTKSGSCAVTPPPPVPVQHNDTAASNASNHKKPTSTPVRSLKQRILQDQQISAALAIESDLKGSDDEGVPAKTTAANNSINSNVIYDVKKKIKSDPNLFPPVSSSVTRVKESKSDVKPDKPEPHPAIHQPVTTGPAPDYEQLNLETVTATDILSQLINESLLSTPHHHEEVVVHTSNDELGSNRIIGNVSPLTDRADGGNKDRRSSTGSRHNRLPSGDQEAKMQMEVDQVIQDLAMLRQMSGGGCGGGSGSLHCGSNEDNISHKSMSGHKPVSSPLFSSSSSCSNPPILQSAVSEPKKAGQSVSSYQNEFYKHLMQKEPISPPPPSLSPVYTKQDGGGSRHQSFQNSSFSDSMFDDIQSKYPPVPLQSVSNQNKHTTQSSKPPPQLSQSPNVLQPLQSATGGVIHHSSTASSHFHQQSSPHYNHHHSHHHSAPPQTLRKSKSDDGNGSNKTSEEFSASLLTKSSQFFNQFHWSLTGNNHRPSS